MHVFYSFAVMTDVIGFDTAVHNYTTTYPEVLLPLTLLKLLYLCPLTLFAAFVGWTMKLKSKPEFSGSDMIPKNCKACLNEVRMALAQ